MVHFSGHGFGDRGLDRKRDRKQRYQWPTSLWMEVEPAGDGALQCGWEWSQRRWPTSGWVRRPWMGSETECQWPTSVWRSLQGWKLNEDLKQFRGPSRRCGSSESGVQGNIESTGGLGWQGSMSAVLDEAPVGSAGKGVARAHALRWRSGARGLTPGAAPGRNVS